jgi:MFS family permease
LSTAATSGLLIASAQAPLGSTLIAVALPSIDAAIDGDLVFITGLLVTGYLAVNVICQGPAGKISDLFGHSRVLWTGISLYVIGAFLGLLAPGIGLLFLSRCTMAVAGALVVPATLALLRLHVPPARRGRVFGVFGATMGIAAAGGPALGGEIVEVFGWRAVFLANLPFLAVSAVLLYRWPLPSCGNHSHGARKELATTIDFVGVGLLAIALGSLILAGKLSGSYSVLALTLAAIVGAAFVAWEARFAVPVFDPRLFKSPTFSAATTMITLQNFAMYGLLFQLPQYFAVFRQTSPREIGYMLFVMMVGMVIAAPVGGQLTDRFGARRASLAGAVFLVVGLVQLWRLASFQTVGDIFLALLMFGLGMGLSNAPAQTSAMNAADSGQAGMAAGVSSTMRYLGAIVSILVMGWVLGDDTVVSVARHLTMIHLFTAVILGSALASRFLPGPMAASNSAPKGRLT